MSYKTIIKERIQASIDAHKQLLKDSVESIEKIALAMSSALKKGHKIYLMGNGGSAADAQHIAAELVGRFFLERNPIPAVALTTNTSVLTAVGNDYGFQNVFLRQLQAFVQKGDVVIGISTSGNSTNILAAVGLAREMGATSIGFTGADGGKLASICDYCAKIPASRTPQIQEGHIMIGHILCEIIEEDIYGKKNKK